MLCASASPSGGGRQREGSIDEATEGGGSEDDRRRPDGGGAATPPASSESLLPHTSCSREGSARASGDGQCAPPREDRCCKSRPASAPPRDARPHDSPPPLPLGPRALASAERRLSARAAPYAPRASTASALELLRRTPLASPPEHTVRPCSPRPLSSAEAHWPSCSSPDCRAALPLPTPPARSTSETTHAATRQRQRRLVLFRGWTTLEPRSASAVSDPSRASTNIARLAALCALRT